MRISIRKIGLSILAATLFVGCFSYNEDILVGEQENTSATKIINSPRSAEMGSLLVKFNEQATLAFEKSKCSSDVTRSNIEPLNIALRNIGAISIERLFPIVEKHEERTRKAGLHRWYVVRFDSNEQLEKAANALAKIAEVDIVQYNSILSHGPSVATVADVDATTRLAVSEVNDPEFSLQWHYYNTGSGIHENQVAGMDINVKDAWRYCTGDPSIVVAIIDGGVDYNHEDLKANMWVNKGEIANNGIDDDGNHFVDDVHGFNHCIQGAITPEEHGTHVAGTVAAVNNNGIGVCGVAGGDGSGNGVRIMSSQLFSGDVKGTIEMSSRAFKYAADNGAVIAQCSWGYEAKDKVPVYRDDKTYRINAGAEYDGILYFQNTKNSDVLDGGLVIFAAGNDSLAMSGYPAGYRDFISVAATGCDGMPAYYTNFGPGTNISAPGGDQKYHGIKGGVYSTLPNNHYGYMMGTSMACPHVSGVAALGLSYAKKLGKKFSLEEFTAMLLLSVDDIDTDLKTSLNEKLSSFYYGNMGSGRVDAFKMLMNVEGTPCITIAKGEYAKIELAPYIADGVANIVIRDKDNSDDNDPLMSKEDVTKLAVVSGPSIKGGKLTILCDNTGIGFVNVPIVVGYDKAGSDDKMGGRATTKKIAIIVRESHSANGGWL